MKIIFGLITLLSLNVFAGEPSYEVTAERVCVLQIMKEAPASLVEACGSETNLSLALTPFSQMEQPAVFQAAMKQAFIQKLRAAVPLTCQEWDNSTALIFICKVK